MGYLKIARAFHIIMGAMDKSTYELIDGQYYKVGVEAKPEQFTSAVYQAALTFKMNPSSLMRFWNKEIYQHLKYCVADSKLY